MEKLIVKEEFPLYVGRNHNTGIPPVLHIVYVVISIVLYVHEILSSLWCQSTTYINRSKRSSFNKNKIISGLCGYTEKLLTILYHEEELIITLVIIIILIIHINEDQVH